MYLAFDVARPTTAIVLWIRLWVCLIVLAPGCSFAWYSELYPADWTAPGPDAGFETNKLIQDFSYAGYHAGEAAVPDISGPIFNAALPPYNADSTGAVDATLAIQNAINTAKSAGGGVVWLPAGLYRVSPQGSAAYALRIDSSGIVLRGAGVGQTFLLNTSTNMRNKVVLLVDGPSSASFFSSGAGSTTLRQDLTGPSRVIPVTSISGFAVNQYVAVRADASDAWVLEHNEPGWVSYSNNLRGVTYFRKVLAVDALARTVTIDSPTRYYLKTRDNARMVRLSSGPLTEVGLEDFSIGNVQHPGTGWREEDYNYTTNAAYYVHNSFLIKFQRARDSWARRIETFQATGNSRTCHLLSNGVLLSEVSRVTLSELHFQRPQFGGGGGNGYMYRLQNANDCLVANCRATFSRHGFVLSHMGSSGNVFHQCIDKDTGRQTGDTGSQGTSGSNSDHHMHFSHSNLIDASTGDNSSWEARYRPYGSVPYHNVTSAHGVYWNMLGTGGGPAYVVRTEQSRYGYVVGTRGTRVGVDRPTYGGTKCNPADHVEGLGLGATLEPFSVYQDQLARRLNLPAVTLPAALTLAFPSNSVMIAAGVRVGCCPPASGSYSAQWSVLSGTGEVLFSDATVTNPVVTFAARGEHLLELVVRAGSYQATGRVQVVLVPSPPKVTAEAVLPVADSFVRDGAYAVDNYGTQTTLQFKKSSAGFNRRSFLRFDLTSVTLTNFDRATVVLRSPGPPAITNAPTLELRAVPNDSWVETSVNWNSQPALGSLLHGWVMSTNGVDQPELTAYAKGEFSGDRLLSVAVQVGSQPGTEVFSFYSRENNANFQPRLLLEDTNAPVTFSNWISSFPGIPPALRDPSDDSDGDRASNLEEFVFLSDPSDEISVPALKIQLVPGGVSLRFRQRAELPAEIGYIFETSTSLEPAEWGPQPGIAFSLIGSGEDSLDWEAFLPANTSESVRLYRLKLWMQQ